MPKQPGGITKFERIEALREVLTRWGKLNKPEIDERVSSKLGCQATDISRALYRDLEDLERLGQITTTHFTRDGRAVENYDPEIHKNTFCEWSIPKENASIRGSKRIRDNHIGIKVSSRLSGSVSIGEGQLSDTNCSSVCFYFSVGGLSHNLIVKAEALPFQVYIGRGENFKITTLSSEEESVFGKRAILFSFPLPGVSSFKGLTKSGHALLSFENMKEVKILDLSSKNGTFYLNLNKLQSEQIVRNISSGAKATSTHALISNERDFKKAQSTTPHVLPLPLQIFFSFELTIIIL